ncbi:Mitochondrial import inner membrane translocase subunit PAM16 like 2 [Sesamum angolense]|uniref:Mitochondrial import inner membrane translocase subunit PAM16 like 2 n=1 Tax=Sesamum angolense TaxID=2727404 RepID=A0AAE1XFZ6_9LAMI|nr:Mitochondrial import inner membrane translocase subunit PAM16 like 2 [Sesamum angolense]
MIVLFSIANYEFVAHILLQAARLLANLIIMGSGIMARAFVQAYRQALANASKNGVAQEAVQNIRRGSKMMTEAEARQILGVTGECNMGRDFAGFSALLIHHLVGKSIL